MALDGDASFAFNIHIVKHLVLELAFGKCSGSFEQPVRQGTLTMVDMCYDTKVSDVFHCRKGIKKEQFFMIC